MVGPASHRSGLPKLDTGKICDGMILIAWTDIDAVNELVMGDVLQVHAERSNGARMSIWAAPNVPNGFSGIYRYRTVRLVRSARLSQARERLDLVDSVWTGDNREPRV